MSYHVQINKLPGNEDVQLPRKMSEQASGFDLHASVAEPVVLAPGERALIPTGIALAMPDGLEAQIRRAAGLLLSTALPASIHRERSMPITAVRLRCC